MSAPARSFPLALDALADWRADAACREIDVEVFFAIDEAAQREAIAVCETCPVRQECLEHAVANREQYGVWGGLREQDRKRLVRARRRDAA
ncbi:WhiB family transcriptional regulator [Nitriliruptor alkaliphilus]|uniref:WhiB family transcriptional regulator n=1 Tax=Nitriliruptor alkaliphilus TaxID=427918 RepID=UPI001FDEC5C5|nr:WhiB family transcriptional regulator [Nitriliruptor alkaliphilus]